jgi:hypothetical protein
VLVIEDHVDSADAVDVLERSGLAGHALVWERGDKLPTLREMIEADRNLLVLAENEGGSAPWYIPAFDLVQDTPYEFEEPGDFSCRSGRGSAASPLFMVNHWLTGVTPDPESAGEVNAYEVLMARAEACRDERGHLPNILAVDFYANGDLFAVVDELNGLN